VGALELENKFDKNYFEGVVKTLLHDSEVEQAGKLIVAADLLEKFEIFDIITKLVETNKTWTATDLINATPEQSRK
jgi:hypothetical protein